MLGPTLETFTIQFLCNGIHKAFLQVTLERRAEILADIFACPLRYFRLSCKNLTINTLLHIFRIPEKVYNFEGVQSVLYLKCIINLKSFP